MFVFRFARRSSLSADAECVSAAGAADVEADAATNAVTLVTFNLRCLPFKKNS